MNPRAWGYGLVISLLLWFLILQGAIAVVVLLGGCTSTVGADTEERPNAVVSAPERMAPVARSD